MPKANRTKTQKYCDILTKAKTRFGDSNCCSLIAVCVLTGKDYETVYDKFRQHGRRKGEGAHTWTILSVLRSLGFSAVAVTRKPKTVNQCEAKMSKSKSFLILTSGHALAMKGGEVHDHSRGSRRIPQNIYQIKRNRKPKTMSVAR